MVEFEWAGKRYLFDARLCHDQGMTLIQLPDGLFLEVCGWWNDPPEPAKLVQVHPPPGSGFVQATLLS